MASRGMDRDERRWRSADGRQLLPLAAALLLLAGCPAAPDSRNASVMAKPDAPSTRSAPVSVVASKQDAGKRPRDLSAATAKELEADSAEKIRKRTKAILAERGYKGPEPSIRSESKVVTMGGAKLAYIEMELDGRSRALEIVGVRDKQLHRVFCFRDSLEPISAEDGACGAKVKEVFGRKTKG